MTYVSDASPCFAQDSLASRAGQDRPVSTADQRQRAPRPAGQDGRERWRLPRARRAARQLTALFNPRKRVPATVEFADIAAPRRERRRTGAARRRARSAMPTRCCTSSGCFATRRSRTRRQSSIRRATCARWRTNSSWRTSGVVERRLERLERDLKKRPSAGASQGAGAPGALPGGARRRPAAARARAAGARTRKRLRGFQFLSAKPLLLVLNLDEGDLPKADDAVRAGGARVVRRRRGDARGADLREDRARDRAARRSRRAGLHADLGLRESGLDRVIRASYDLLGYISFFTVGEDECRAWSIPRDTSARAGRRGDPLGHLARLHPGGSGPLRVAARAGSLAACRDHGELRLEGKEYIVLDGDVINFRHAT